MRPLQEIIAELHAQLAKPAEQSELLALIREFDENCSSEETIKVLRNNKETLAIVRLINKKIIEIFANTISSITSKALSELDLEQLKTWPRANSFIKLIDLWNSYNFFILDDILKIKKLEHRNLVIERWIAVARKMHKEQDFFGAQVVYQTVIKTDIERLYKDTKDSLSKVALERLEKLRAIYEVPTKTLYEVTIFPATGPKMSNVYSAVQSSKANLEGSGIEGQMKEIAIRNSEEYCRTTIPKMYSSYAEKIPEHTVLRHLRMEILLYMPKARDERMDQELKEKRNKLQSKQAALMAQNAGNTTPEKTLALTNLVAEIGEVEQSLEALKKEIAIHKKSIQDKTMAIKSRRATLPASRLTAKVGSLLPPSPAMPSEATPVIPRVLTPLPNHNPNTRGRSHSASAIKDRDAIPADLHGSNIVIPMTEAPKARGRSSSLSRLTGLFQRGGSVRVKPSEKTVITTGTSSLRVKRFEA